MLNREWLINLLRDPKLSTTDKILSVLLDEEAPEKPIGELRDICIAHGAREASNWGFSGFLASAEKQGRVVRIGKRWSLTNGGRDSLREQGITMPDTSPLPKARNDLRMHLPSIANPQTQEFVEEAIRCLEAKLLRAAVVMSWIGAIDILHDHVAQHYLATFNNVASSDKNWNPAINVLGLSQMPEGKFLDVLEKINVIDHSTKIILRHCLDERNACGHPSNYQLGEQSVAAHIEKLIQNVYAKF